MNQQIVDDIAVEAGEQAASLDLLRLVRLREHVVADDRDDVLAQPRRVVEPLQRALGNVGADLLVRALALGRVRVVVQAAVLAAPRRLRLAAVVEQRRHPCRQRAALLSDRVHDPEGVLVHGQVVVLRLLLEADHGSQLREQRLQRLVVTQQA